MAERSQGIGYGALHAWPPAEAWSKRSVQETPVATVAPDLGAQLARDAGVLSEGAAVIAQQLGAPLTRLASLVAGSVPTPEN